MSYHVAYMEKVFKTVFFCNHNLRWLETKQLNIDIHLIPPDSLQDLNVVKKTCMHALIWLDEVNSDTDLLKALTKMKDKKKINIENLHFIKSRYRET